MSESAHEVEERRKLTLGEKMISFVSPEMAYRRMVAREKIHEFAAVRRSGARGKLATAYDQGSSESWKKQRERLDAMWEARAMEENFCVIAGLLQKLAIYICGQLEFQPETGDKVADETYADYFHEWCGRADYAERHRFRMLVQLAVSSAIRDGQFGFIERIEDGELRLQAIEGDRIGNPHSGGSTQDDTDIHGILVDERGRVKGYEIYQRTRTVQYTKQGVVEPENFIHLFFPHRADQVHGVSKLAPALPHARDLYELFGYEKVAAKFAASFAAFVKTRDAGAPGSGQWRENPEGKQFPATMAAQAGTVVRVENGVDEIEFAPGVQRPSGAFMALVEALFREIAQALNLPFGFVYDMARFGGVTARLETEAAGRVFRWYQEQLEHKLLNRVAQKVLMMGIASGKLKWTKHWRRGSWRYGATLTGDVGHQTRADLDLVAAGVKTRSQLAAAYNNDLRQVMEKTGAEVRYAIEVSKRNKVPLEFLLRDIPNATQLLASYEAAERGEGDEAAAEPPVPAGLIGEVGDKGVKPLLDLVLAVNRGEMDRSSAVHVAMTVYGLPVEEAELLFRPVGRIGLTGG